MAGLNSVQEILEFAIAREAEAYQFYRTLANRVENPAISEIILEFAKEELEHKAKLELEVFKSGKSLKETSNVVDINIEDYLVDSGDVDVMNIEYTDLLMLAIKKEDRAFRLYVALSGMANDNESQEVLMSMAMEEAAHKILFEIEYNDMIPKHR
ncbi:MAG: ferritin family protein [Planctomycetota bacterium]|jgi:rubrerythrin